VLLQPACAPINETYYAIETEAKHQKVRNICRETVPSGPYGTAIVEGPENVSFEISSSTGESGFYVRVVVRIPQGVSLKFSDNRFIAENSVTAEVFTNRMNSLYHYSSHQVRAKDKWEKNIFTVLEGDTTSIGSSIFGKREINKAFYLDIIFGIYDARAIQFFMPPMLINEIPYSIPVTNFIQESGWFVYPLNC